jgi:hypothetical protein
MWRCNGRSWSYRVSSCTFMLQEPGVLWKDEVLGIFDLPSVVLLQSLSITMMKAAGIKRGSRKKQQAQSNSGNATTRELKEERPYVPPPVQQQPQQPSPQAVMQQQQPHRRKSTSEEGALTNKNYRLAKELVRRKSFVVVGPASFVWLGLDHPHNSMDCWCHLY